MADENLIDDNERGGLDIIQSMIDISADRLEGLRTQCATSAELTQQEIRSLETKLVKMFSELLITKAKIPERLPRGLPATGAELKQWLRVVGKWFFSSLFLFCFKGYTYYVRPSPSEGHFVSYQDDEPWPSFYLFPFFSYLIIKAVMDLTLRQQ